jgi:hypothetical protein
VLCLTLDGIVFPLGVLGPIQRQTIADQPFAEVDAIDRTRRYRPPVLIEGDRDTAHRPAGNEGVEIIGGFRPAPILQTVPAPTKLTAFGSVHPPEADARAVDFKRVAIDDAGLAGEIVCSDGGRPYKNQRARYCPAPRRSILCNLGDDVHGQRDGGFRPFRASNPSGIARAGIGAL